MVAPCHSETNRRAAAASRILLSAVLLTALVLLAVAGSASARKRAAANGRTEQQTTQLISRARDGGLPNGPSTHAVISGDKRYARLIAFESDASDLVLGDANGTRDVFAVLRDGPVDNEGSPWRAARTVLVSRTRSGEPANGPSFAPSVDGGFGERPSCVAFLSAASNIVPGDTNGKVDAFLSRDPGDPPIRVSLPRGRQGDADTTAVAVSGDCSRVAFVTGGKLFVRANGGRPFGVADNAADPSFSTGLRNDLVYGAPGGVFLSKGGTERPRLVGPGGRNPAYNDIKRQVVAYEKTINGHDQVVFRDLGEREQVASARRSSRGNGDSRNPVIGNSGYYITFESDADNLGVNALSRQGDFNHRPDVYLYTNVRDITLVQSVEEKAVPLPGGGQNPSMSFYANYIVFDSPSALGSENGPRQVYMRYLGPV